MERIKFYNGELYFNWTQERGTVSVLDSNKSGEGVIAQTARLCRGVVPSGEYDAEKDGKTIKMLLQAKHNRPFDFANMTFLIHSPIFVERQLRVYRTATILERSLRACLPVENCAEYNALLESGEPKELARRVLPLGTFTTYAYNMSVRNLLHLFQERLTKATQIETRYFAQLIWQRFAETFPQTAQAFSALNTELLYAE